MSGQTKQIKKSSKNTKYCSIGQASELLGVSIATLRRWEKAGKIKAERLDGKNRSFKVADLEKLSTAKPLSTAATAKQLRISESSVRRLQQKGELVGQRGDNGKYLFNQEAIDTYKQLKASRKASKATSPSLSEMVQQEAEKRLEQAENFLEDENEGYISPAEIPHPFFGGILAAVATIALLITPWKTFNNVSPPQTTPVASNTRQAAAKPATPIDGANIIDRTITGAKLASETIDFGNLSKEVQKKLANNPITNTIYNQYSTNAYNTTNVYNTTYNTGGNTIIAGTGMSSSTTGSDQTLSVNYGSTAGTAAEGNKAVICPSGTGNLTGGGNSVTVGAGGACNSLGISNNPTFTGQVTAGSLSTDGQVTFSGLGTGLVRSSATGALSTNFVQNSDFDSTQIYSNITNLNNVTVGGQLTVSGLANGIVKSNAGTLSGGNTVTLGADTTGSYIQSLGTLTGLNTTGNTGAGSTPTISVAYGSTANTSVQGNTTLICPSGTGNLSGTGNTITLGSGGTCNSLSIVDNPTFTGLMTSLGVNAGTGSIQGTGGIAITGNSTITGTLAGLTGIASSGTITFSGLASGIVKANSSGVLTGGNTVTLGTDTIGSYIQNLGTLTGLTTTGNTGAGSTPTISVAYGSAANTSVQGNRTVICPSGTGNLSGTGNTITLGSGGTCNSLSIVNNPTFSGLMTSLGVNAGTGSIQGTGGIAITGNSTITGTLSGLTGLTVASGGTTITAGNLNVTAGDINTAGTQRLSNAGALNNITGYSQSSGNFSQSGTGTFGTATGSVSLNGNTTIASGKTLSVGGNTSVSGNLSLTRTNGTGTNYITAGTWGVLQDRNLLADTSNANNYRTILTSNAYVSDQTTNTYSQLNTYGNKWDLELGGAQTSLRYRAGSGGVADTWTDTGWTDLMTVSNTSATFKGGSNSTTAFQIQNASAVALLSADTTNGIVSARNYAANESLVAGSDLLGGLNWTDNGNWNGASTNAATNTFQHITTGGTSPYTQTLSNTWTPTLGNYYQVTFTITGRTLGSISISMGGVSSQSYSSSGSWTPKPVTATASDNLVITPTANFDGTVVFSVKQLTYTALSPTLRVVDSAGSSALEVRTGGLSTLNNLFVGSASGRYNTTGSVNVALGGAALRENMSGFANTALGYTSLLNNSAGNYNTAAGYQSLLSNNTGLNNSAFGVASLYSNTTGTNNTGIGMYALYNYATASNNTAVGYAAMQGTSGSSTGSSNVAVGALSLYSNTSGTQNTVSGIYSMQSNTTGGSNVALGYAALYSNQTSSDNVSLGTQSMYFNTGSQNVAVGRNALYAQTSGANNTALGYQAGRAITTGSSNTFAGNQAGYDPSNVSTTTTSSTSSSTTLPVTSATGIALGQSVSGTGIAANTYVAGISGLNITLSAAASVASGASINFGIQKFDASNSTGLGNGALTTANNQIILGNSSVNQVNIQGNPSNSIYQTTTAGTTISSLLQLGNRLTSSSANTSSSGGTYFGINAPSSGTGSAADFINLQNNGTSVLTVGSSGNTVHKTSTNSTTAFQIQNATGSSLLTVDTLTTSNLLTNGDMESSTNSTSLYGWATVGTGTTFSQTTPFWQGKYALSVSATAGNANGGASNAYTFAANTTYTLSFYARVPSGTITDIVAGRQDVSGTDITCLTGQTLTTTYTRFSCTFTTGATITTSNIFIQRSGTAAETFLIDGVQLQLGSSASTFNVGGAPQFSFNTSKLQVMNSAGTTNYLSVDTVNNRTNLGGTLVTNASNLSPDGARNGAAIILDPTTSASNTASILMTNGTAYRYALRSVYSGSAFDLYLGDNNTALVNSVVLQPGSTGYAGVDLPSSTGTQTNGFWVNRSAAGGTTTNMVNIQNSAGTATNALTFTGTFTNLINSTNFTVTNGGNVTLNVASSTAGFALCTVANGAGTKTIEDCAAAPSADYAEQYPLASGIDYGDIVATGSKAVNTYADENGSVNWDKVKGQITELVKTSSGYQGNTVGIVSDNHGDFTSAGHNIKDEDNPMPVALNGRVPVNMAPDSEPVSAGDYLTTSGTYPGKATKATGSGYVIGKALAGWNTGQEQVMVFVEPGYNSGPSTLSYIQDGGSATLVNLTVNGNLEVKGLLKVADIEVNGHIITRGDTPQITAKDAAGNGASVSIEGNDTSGTITINSGSGANVGDLAEITFAKAFGSKPRVILSASNDKAAKLQFFKSASKTGFVLKAVDGAGQTSDNTTYEIDYQIMQ